MSSVALVTGARGQVGRAVVASVPAGWTVVGVDRTELDITDEGAVRRVLEARAPSVVINCAAYTAVDRAEREPELARRVNGGGAGIVARATRLMGTRLVHLSTDFVFDGMRGTPYLPSDSPAPLSVYGHTKLEGEREVSAAKGDAIILRTAWVYAAYGKNFFLTILRLLGGRQEIRVVDDQISTPTWATGLARAIWSAALLPGLTGLYHWTDAGVASWYDFAVAIREEALARGVLSRAAEVLPISAADSPRPARRPAFSVLDKRITWAALGSGVHWREQIRKMFEEYHLE